MLNGDASMQMLQGSRFSKYQLDSANKCYKVHGLASINLIALTFIQFMRHKIHNKDEIFTKGWYRI
jgi:hypothetical protein